MSDDEIEFEMDVYLEHLTESQVVHVYQYPTRPIEAPIPRPHSVKFVPQLNQISLQTVRPESKTDDTSPYFDNNSLEF